MRRQHSSGRDGLDFEAGELAGPGEPPLSRSGWDQKPGQAPIGARDGRYGGGISRTASLPLGGRVSAPELLPLAPDLPGPPPLHRSVSHPATRPISPQQRSVTNGPLANGGGSLEAMRSVPEEQHSRSSSFPVAYMSLPHHLVSQPSHSLPPGIMSRRSELPPPPAPPLLASPVLPDLAPPAVADGAPSPALPRAVAELAAAGGVTPARQPPEAEAAEAGELSTPAGSIAGDLNATPVSDDPPKRKRLGWGQGLARLRSVDKRGLPADDHSEHSPRDSEASRHTDAGAQDSSALNSPSFSARTDDAMHAALSPAVPAPDSAGAPAGEPAASAIPPPPALLMVEPAVVIEAPAEAVTTLPRSPPPPPPQPPPAAATLVKGLVDAPAAVSLPSALTPLSPGARPAVITPSPEARASVASPGLLPPAPAASMEPSPIKQEEASAHDAAVPSPEPGKAADYQDVEEKPSKEVIMRQIDTADSEIEALERQMAKLSAALDADAAALRGLSAEVAQLETARPMEIEPPEEEFSLAQSSQVRFLPAA